jgi:MFS family permease
MMDRVAEHSIPWYRQLNRYHWFVLSVAALGWIFDCLDQQLFILARQPAMQELVQGSSTPAREVVDAFASYATAIFLVGWGGGGLLFGVLGDRIGRAKTMLITILVYSVFTGFSAASLTFWDFVLYRFLTGLGVGGEFAVGVALVAEVMPDRARPYALSLLQALSAVGNVTAAMLNMAMGGLVQFGLIDSVWRPLFVVGAVPALLVLVVRRRLREPERWQAAAHGQAAARQLGSYRALFGDPRWRKHALVGLGLAFSGVVGLWAVGFFTMDLVGNVLTARFTAEGLPPYEVAGRAAFWKSVTSLMINGGGFVGMCSFGILTQHIGRKSAFTIAFVAALASTAAVFLWLCEFWQIFVLVPVMGFCQLALFAGYAIYFPELFPTHLRSTGTSFCYNVGRFVAALGPALLGLLTSHVFASTEEPLRYAGLTMCGIFVIGLLVLPLAPETKDQPLPE